MDENAKGCQVRIKIGRYIVAEGFLLLIFMFGWFVDGLNYFAVYL